MTIETILELVPWRLLKLVVGIIIALELGYRVDAYIDWRERRHEERRRRR